ncbi:MAG: hypothetical protein NUV91_01035 [Candidatus Omnitrophica bacterium]|nr:hypothetical protein [Candidatus Omnitrophota bacterium]
MTKIKKFSRKSIEPYLDEPAEWISLTPAERIQETTRLWQIYLSLGGSLDPEPDPQSPFYIPEK